MEMKKDCISFILKFLINKVPKSRITLYQVKYNLIFVHNKNNERQLFFWYTAQIWDSSDSSRGKSSLTYFCGILQKEWLLSFDVRIILVQSRQSAHTPVHVYNSVQVETGSSKISHKASYSTSRQGFIWTKILCNNTFFPNVFPKNVCFGFVFENIPW